MRIYKDFLFEAAHYLPSAPPGHPNSRMHGHSFRARIIIDGEPDPQTGLVMHFDELATAIGDTRDALDHRMLNEIDGLAAPTLERISMWIWNKLQNRVPGLAEVHIYRDSCHEGCLYTGPVPALRQAAE